MPISDSDQTQLDDGRPGWSGALAESSGSAGSRIWRGRNVLLTAAREVFRFGMELEQHARGAPLSELRQQAARHIQLFEHQARSLGVTRPQLLLARYGLCTFLDELVAILPKHASDQADWDQDGWYPAKEELGANDPRASGSATGFPKEAGNQTVGYPVENNRQEGNRSVWHQDEWHQEEWSQESLLSRFHGETYGGQDFFVILRRICAEPAQSLDLLELWFVILSLGFEGKYRLEADGGRKLDQVRELLLALIRSYRGDFHPGFCVGGGGPTVRTHPRRTISWRVLIGGVFVCLALLQGVFYSVLDREYQELQAQLNTLVERSGSGLGGV